METPDDLSYSRLSELQSAWALRFSKRAAGGAVSLAGFLYQFEVTLLAAVRTWLREPVSPTVLIEALSDLTQPKPEGGWLITQVKRTGSSGSIASALDELWTIHQVALEVTPTLVGALTYEVRCARWDVKDISKRLSSWRAGTAGDATILAAFLDRVRVTTDTHPLDELLALLTNELRCVDPLAWVREHVGLLTELAAGSYKAEHVSQKLFGALGTLRNSRDSLPRGVQIINASDREPETPVRGDYLVGEAPRLRHLREGYFAPRNWQVEPLIDEFVSWMESDPFSNDRSQRVPLFWIAGRSGCGKSVLLLQVTARLAELGVGPLVWLSQNREQLADAMEWALRACGPSKNPVLVLDDPYAPGVQEDAIENWQRAVGVLDAARDSGNQVPLLLACGPTEQAKRLEHDFSDDLQVRTWLVDEAIDNQHVGELLEWFESRTGRVAPEVGRGDVLLVQRFFEWRTGEPLGTFAARFRGRVVGLEPDGRLAKFVAALLAVNRLYAGLPLTVRSSLTATALDGLDRLQADHHVAIDAEGGRPGLWLTHPHLSDALFRGWFGKR